MKRIFQKFKEILILIVKKLGKFLFNLIEKLLSFKVFQRAACLFYRMTTRLKQSKLLKNPKLIKKLTSSYTLIIGLILLILLGFYLGTVLFKKPASAGWFDDGWHYRRKLTFDNASSSENLTDFPVLVSLNSSRINYSNTQNSGQDIRFTDSSGEILSHEIEEWNESGTSTAWVKVPQIDAQSTVNYIYMYYGNSSASDGQDAQNVWDSNFKMIQHLQEASTSSNAYIDSTSNNNHGTASSTVAADNLDVTGKISGANEFDGADDYLEVLDDASLDISDNITVEAWVKYDTATTTATATGGDSVYTYEDGGESYKAHEFTSVGTSTLTIEDGSLEVEYIIVAGGAGGGRENNEGGIYGNYGGAGGGGAGGYRSSVTGESSGGGASVESSLSLDPGTYIIAVGEGGAGKASSAGTGSDGEDSSFYTITATGGGAGGGGLNVGNNGGSGGGGGGYTAEAGGSGTAGQGYDGGDGSYCGGVCSAAGGGGGAGGSGGTSGCCGGGGAGGSGVSSSITGSSVTYATGGDGTGGVEGTTGGSDASANTGDGGEGGSFVDGGDGGSGIVVVRYSVGIGEGKIIDKSTSTYSIVVDQEADETTGFINTNEVSTSTEGGVWQHVILTYNDSAQKIYIDGEQVNSTPLSGAINTNSDNVKIGDSFLGTIDEIRISDTARSADWIEAQYKSMTDDYITYGSEENSPEPVLLWRLDEGTESTAYDDSNYDNDGTITTGGSTAWITGKLGNAVFFNGTSTKITATDANSLDMGTSDWSLSTWIKTSASVTSTIMTKGGMSGESANWYNASWNYRKQLTFDNASSSETLSDFPVLVKLTPSNFSYNNSSSTGADVRFTDSDGTSLIDYEIEKWDQNGTSTIWVEVPDIATSSATDNIYIYYGNDSASSVASSTAVWDENYKGVWHLSGTSSDPINDSTSNSNNGTFKGSSLDFDGGDHVNVPHSGSLDIGGQAISMEAWVKPGDTSQGGQVIRKSWSDYWVWKTYVWGDGSYVGKISTSNGNEGISSTGLNEDQWYHAVVTYDGSYIRVYINGSEDSDPVSHSGNISTDSRDLVFGEDDPYSNHFDGAIDEVRIYNRTLSADEIEEHYQGVFSDDSGLVGLWHFDEASGQTVGDDSGSGNNGTRGADSGSSGDDPTWVTNTRRALGSGKIDGADVFDGMDDYIDGGTDSSLNWGSGDGTTCAWVKTSASSGSTYRVVVIKGAGGSSQKRYVLHIDGDDATENNVPRFDIDDDSSLKEAYDNNSINDGNWHSLCGVRDGNNLRLYVDGAEGDNSPTDITGYGDIDDTEPLTIGAINNSGSEGDDQFFDGTIDEVRISNTARSADWIEAQYKSMSDNYVTYGSEENPPTGYKMEMLANGKIQASISNTTTSLSAISSNSVNDNSWQHIEATYDREGDLVIYINGQDKGSTDISSLSSDDISNANNLYAGVDYTGSANYFSGSIDDIRIYNYTRSLDEVRMDYEGDLASSLPIQFGADTAGTTNWGLDDWSYRKKITIDHTKVATSSQTDFPVLINSTSTDWKDSTNGGKVGQSDGGDILFTMADGTAQLKHEIESYASSTGHLVAWVKIPTLSASEDTEIYMYYGNSSCADQWDVQNVWDSNYKIVQHLQESDIDGGSGDIKDSTSNNNDGTTSGMDTNDDVNAQVNGGFDFDGVDDYIDTNSKLFSSWTEVTMSAWIKTAQSDRGHLISCDPDGNGPDVRYEVNGGVVKSVIDLNGGGNAQGVAGSTYINDSTWHLVTFTFDNPSDTGKIYVDGSLDNSDGTITNDPDISLINEYYFGGNANYGVADFNGTIDEVRISDTDRSAEWIKTSYNNQSSPSTFYSINAEEDAAQFLGKPIAYWRTDKGSGVVAYDDTSNDNDLVISGATWSSSGKFGNALSFDGTDDKATTSNSSSLNITGNLAIASWVKATDFSTTTLQWIAHKDSDSTGYGFGFGSTTNDLFLSIDGTKYESSSNFSLTDNAWHHLGVSLASTTATFYIDGRQLGNTVACANAPPASATSTNLTIASDGTNYFSGLLDEIKVYNYARTAQEMKVDYNRGMAVNLGEGDISGGVSGIGGDDGWWNSNWHKRIKLTIDNASSSETLTNFPALVTLTSSRISYSDTQNSGQDIRFTDNHGVELKYEIEEWDESATSTVWVKIPSITAGSTNEYIYMYYDNPDASDAQDAQNVWDSNYKMVQHLQESDIDGGSGDIKDSTSNNNDGTTSGMNTNDDVDARVDGGFDFDGSDDYIDTGDIGSLSSFTAAIWFNTDSLSARQYPLQYQKDTERNLFPIRLELNTDGTIDGGTVFATSGFVEVTETGISPGSFYYIVYTYDGSTQKIYKNAATPTTNSISESISSGYNQNLIGIRIKDGSPDGEFNGLIDEVRISDTARLADWIEAQYKSMTDTFLTYSSSESPPEPVAHWRLDEGQGTVLYDDSNYDNDAAGSLSDYLSNYDQRMEITIGSTNIDENLTHFPIPITIGTSTGQNSEDSTAIFDEVGSNWQKIAVTKDDGTTQLYVEKEQWATSTEEAVLWVSKSDWTVSSTTDTTIYLYYDNDHADNTTYVADVGSRTEVWDSNYKGVWHLSEGSGSALDSTSNNNDGSFQGDLPTQIEGYIAEAHDFDGSGDYVDIGNSLPLGSTPRTTLAWIKPDDSGSNDPIVQYGETGTRNAWRVWLDNSRVQVAAYADDSHFSNQVVSVGSWNMAGVTYDGSTGLSFYVDGEPEGSSTLGGSLNTSIDYYGSAIGGYTDGYLNGYIDEVRISNVARNAAWIKACYHAQDDNVLDWGGEAKTEAGSYFPTWTTGGKYGNALDFNGSDDYVSVSDSISTSVIENLTISAWIRPDAVSKEQTILGKWDETTAANNKSYRLWLDSSNKINFSVSADGSATTTHTGSNTTFSADTWYHVEAVYNASSTMDVYVNGQVDVAQKSSSVPASIDDNASNLYFGGKENTSGNIDTLFDGAIDDVKIYSYARSAEQVLIDYNGGFAAWMGN